MNNFLSFSFEMNLNINEYNCIQSQTTPLFVNLCSVSVFQRNKRNHMTTSSSECKLKNVVIFYVFRFVFYMHESFTFSPLPKDFPITIYAHYLG